MYLSNITKQMFFLVPLRLEGNNHDKRATDSECYNRSNNIFNELLTQCV